MEHDPSGHIGESAGEFSVCQFFQPSGNYEYVRRYVSAEEAVAAFKHYTSNVTAKMGLCNRVIITDGEDCCNFEWIYGKGIVFPLRGAVEEAQKLMQNTENKT